MAFISAGIRLLRRTNLYSKPGARVTLRRAALFALIGLAWLLPAQVRKRQPHPGPRSIAVLEWPAGTKPEAMDKVTPTLVPAIVYQNLRYFDATIYMAKPVPLALDRGVFYEAQKGGIFAGEYMVESARGGNADDPDSIWYGVGLWNSAERIAARDAERNKRKAAKSKQDSAYKELLADDKPPKIRRTESIPAGNPPPSKPAESGAKVGATRPLATEPLAGVSDNDPNRPLLRRGSFRTGAQISTEPRGPLATPSGALAKRPVMIAVSDAKTEDAVRFEFAGSVEDRKRLEQEAMKLLQAELGGEAASKAVRKNAKAQASSPQLTDLNLHIFDLFGANQATVVLSAALPGTPERAVILVAAEDATGTLQKLLFEKTDASRLDVQGRLLLVDAVDATGEGYGDLLFRRIGERSETFELYRSYGSQLLKLF